MLRDYRAHIRFCHEILSLLKLGGSYHTASPTPLNQSSGNSSDNSPNNGSDASTTPASENAVAPTFVITPSVPSAEKPSPSEKIFIDQVDVMLRIIHAHILIGDLKGVKEVVEECVQLAQVCSIHCFKNNP